MQLTACRIKTEHLFVDTSVYAEEPKSVLISEKSLTALLYCAHFQVPNVAVEELYLQQIHKWKNATWIVSIILHDNP